MATSDPPIRVSLQQPVLPAYRVPVFHELSKRPGIDLTVYYGDMSNSPSSVSDVPFHASFVHLREMRLAGHPILWHGPQWTGASRRRSDTLVLSWDIHYASLIPSLLRAKRNGVRTVLWGHGYSKREQPWRRWPRERVAGLADALLFYNRRAADAYLENGWDRRRVFVAPNAIDQSPIQAARDYWASRPDELDAFKKENGLGSEPMILFVSRLDPNNRLDLLLEALKKIEPMQPTIQVVVIGNGADEQTRLTAMRDRLGLSDRVRFLGPIYDERSLAPWFLCSKLFCYPANIGLSILHAFGYGLPVITSDQIGAQNPEIESLEHDANGLTYADADADALGQAILTILGDESTRARLSAGAYRTASQTYSLSAMVDGMVSAIRGEAV
ncbi:MAG: glycosyltransferase family 4 protein [Phycisphaeraceae bacterium]